jgi:hypothetical protein
VTHQPSNPSEALQDRAGYAIATLEDEIRADRQCAALLKQFHQYLLRELRTEPLEAGALAAGADYFLREFIIGDRRENILEIPAVRIRQFGGHWYIVRNLEPNREELDDMLQGTAAFYRYCAARNLIAETAAEAIAAECGRLDDYIRRIEAFHAISGGGFKNWRNSCPLD